MVHNACIFERRLLDGPMKLANPNIGKAFEAHAMRVAEKLRSQQGIAHRAREVVLAQLQGGSASMSSVARAMAASVATLRRRLEESGTSYSEIVDQVRYDLAREYLSDTHIAVREIAFLLGYSHAKAFYSAFRRWTGGSSPAEYRAEILKGRP